MLRKSAIKSLESWQGIWGAAERLKSSCTVAGRQYPRGLASCTVAGRQYPRGLASCTVAEANIPADWRPAPSRKPISPRIGVLHVRGSQYPRSGDFPHPDCMSHLGTTPLPETPRFFDPEVLLETTVTFPAKAFFDFGHECHPDLLLGSRLDASFERAFETLGQDDLFDLERLVSLICDRQDFGLFRSDR